MINDRSFNSIVESFRAYPILEGRYDPGIFKAVFLGGGSGSGKGYVAIETGLVDLFDTSSSLATFRTTSSFGLKLLDSDQALLFLIQQGGRDTNLAAWDQDDLKDYRDRAKDMVRRQADLYIQGKLGVLIDTTASSPGELETVKNNYESYGYDTMMVFVMTPLDDALAGNEERYRRGDRYVAPEVVTKKWQECYDALPTYERIFGNNLVIVENRRQNPGATSSAINNAASEIRRFMSSPPSNPIALEWLANA